MNPSTLDVAQLPATVRANLGLVTQLQLAIGARLRLAPGQVSIHTPACPDYYFGNYLLMARAPTAAQCLAWAQDFEARIGSPVALAHRVFVWPEPMSTGPEPPACAGYAGESLLSMGLRPAAVAPPTSLPMGLSIRPFRRPADWRQWLALQATVTPGAEHPQAHRRYLAHQTRSYRTLTARGLGGWWGVFSQNDELLAYLGLYRLGTHGRFQAVTTRADWRRRGLCRALLGTVLWEHRTQVSDFVIVADALQPARQLYGRLGFVPAGRIASLLKVTAR